MSRPRRAATTRAVSARVSTGCGANNAPPPLGVMVGASLPRRWCAPLSSTTSRSLSSSSAVVVLLPDPDDDDDDGTRGEAVRSTSSAVLGVSSSSARDDDDAPASSAPRSVTRTATRTASSPWREKSGIWASRELSTGRSAGPPCRPDGAMATTARPSSSTDGGASRSPSEPFTCGCLDDDDSPSWWSSVAAWRRPSPSIGSGGPCGSTSTKVQSPRGVAPKTYDGAHGSA
mmetsp:Transcript_26437/g.105790  ORF Transcript_26437/g.105790 Transcript_26437/m.105790 type:complete len:231 (+) Transcript_26437:966-1658(+)